jgi:hypothetical protein
MTTCPKCNKYRADADMVHEDWCYTCADAQIAFLTLMIQMWKDKFKKEKKA